MEKTGGNKMKTNIKPKTAYIEIECPIDKFFFVWDNDKENQPTQEDYDRWAIENAEQFLEDEKYELDNHLKLK
jgi:hypothetical protein